MERLSGWRRENRPPPNDSPCLASPLHSWQTIIAKPELASQNWQTRTGKPGGGKTDRTADNTLANQATLSLSGSRLSSGATADGAAGTSIHDARRLRNFRSLPDSLRAHTPMMAEVESHPPIINFTTKDITCTPASGGSIQAVLAVIVRTKPANVSWFPIFFVIPWEPDSVVLAWIFGMGVTFSQETEKCNGLRVKRW